MIYIHGCKPGMECNGTKERKLMSGRSDNPTLRETFISADFMGKTALILSSWFGIGLAPKAPGTFGTLGAVPLAIVFSYFGFLYQGIAIIVIIPLALWSSEVSRKLLGREDPQVIVIDEVAGLLLAVFLFPLSLLSIILGFVLFRFFDILKPFPVRLIDQKVKGGLGIVLDDLMAGIYANLCLRIIFLVVIDN